jgi:hypothetical protein
MTADTLPFQKFRRPWVQRILPVDFDREDQGGLDHLRRQIATKGYLTVESNCDDAWPSPYGSDESDINTIIGWHAPQGFASRRGWLTKAERAQLEYEKAMRERREARWRESDQQWAEAQGTPEVTRIPPKSNIGGPGTFSSPINWWDPPHLWIYHRENEDGSSP